MSVPFGTRVVLVAWLAVGSLLASSTDVRELDRRAAEAWDRADHALASKLYEDLVEREPGASDAWLRLGWSRYRSGAFATALRAFERAAETAAVRTDADVGIGYASLQLGDVDAALASLERALGARPGDRDALRGIVLAARRGEGGARVARAGLDAAERLLDADPGDRELQLVALTLDRELGGPGERRLRAPTPRAAGAPPAYRFRTAPRRFEVLDDGAWRPLFVKGFNLGVALPGKFPTQFPRSVELYREWLASIADLGANVVRVYTLLPPEFYRALSEYNAAHGDDPLWLVQGVWTELPPGFDFDDPEFLDELHAEVARVIDAVHGNLALAPRPGHASGLYDVDVSSRTLAYILGREWEPFAVQAFDEANPGAVSWRGRFFEVDRGLAMERWVARLCEFAAAYEADRHGVIRPLTFANWPTLDPMRWVTESNRDEEDAWKDHYGVERPDRLAEHAWENDRAAIDSTRIRPTAAYPAGFFASYHVYPNYPDFMNLEPALAGGRDADGPSRYAAYLERLVDYHGDQPVLIAEFGMSSSRGVAHVQPQGWHHGGHDEREQARVVGRLLRSIRDVGCAGGIVFAFLDEWFKGTWSVAPIELPHERRRLWFNAESPEQSYGFLAARPARAGITVDGRSGDWEGIAPLVARPEDDTAEGWSALRALRVTSDEGYLYLLLETAGQGGAPPFDRVGYRVAIDTYARDRGERTLDRAVEARFPAGVEIVVELDGPDASRVRTSAPYEPYAGVDRGCVASPRGGSGELARLTFVANRERFARDGTRYPAEVVERGSLRFGSLDPEAADFDTRADVSIGPDDGVIEMRLPWGLLSVADPSRRHVLHDTVCRDGRLDTVATEGFGLYALAFERGEDAPGRLVSRLPDDPARRTSYLWDPWDEPTYRLEWKHGVDRLREIMTSIPDHPEAVGRREADDVP